MERIYFILVLSLGYLFFMDTNTEYSEIQEDVVFTESITRGKEIYLDMCASCHLPNGEGKLKVYPPLAKADFLMEKREESIRAIKYGIRGEIVVNGITYNRRMARQGLDAIEIADVMNYITNAWGNTNNKMITVEEVDKVSKK